MNQPIFYVRRGDRLIARLKHILYAWRFAKQVKGKAIVMWPSPGAWKIFDSNEYSPSLIFDTTRIAQDTQTQDLEFLETNELFPPDRRSLRNDEFTAVRNNKFDRVFFEQEGLVFHEDTLMHYHFRDESPKRVTLNAELSQLFNLLPLHPQVSALLEDIRKDLDGLSFVCLHARGGDVFNMLQTELPPLAKDPQREAKLKRLIGHYVARTAPLEMYIPWVQQAIEQGMKVVFSSDSPEQIKWFESRFGRDHFVNLAAYQAEHPIQKALVDFMVLMRGSRLFGTRSNFSSLACDLASIEHTIVSSAARNGMAEKDVVQLYFEQAMSRFLPDELPGSDLPNLVEAEIQRHYRFVNRLGTKEELSLLDPRKRATPP